MTIRDLSRAELRLSRTDKLAMLQEGDMSRSRFQKGSLIQEGIYWRVRYYEDAVDGEGNFTRKRPKVIIGPHTGPGRLTRAQAEARMAEIMGEVNENAWRPASLMTCQEFYDKRFTPEHVVHCEYAGQMHYKHYLGYHVMPSLGKMQLRDVTVTHVRMLIGSKASKYAPGTLKHIKGAIRKLFNHAKEAGFYGADNPAAHVKIPKAGKPTKKIEGYTEKEAAQILQHLKSPLWEMAILAMSTSMNVAELCGLRVRRVNLTGNPVQIDGEIVPALSIAVRENLYQGRRGDVKTGNRRRNLPIPAAMVKPLGLLCAGKGPQDPVFVMPTNHKRVRELKPVNAHNVTNRTFQVLTELLKFKVNWHRFRHTHATFTDRLGLDPEDRRKMLGHGSHQMTAHYTHPFERQRSAADAIVQMLLNPKKKQESDTKEVIQ